MAVVAGAATAARLAEVARPDAAPEGDVDGRGGGHARAARWGKVALVVVPRPTASVEYRLDPSRPESALARARVDDALQRAAGRRDPVADARWREVRRARRRATSTS